ncbi:MAG TPA: phage tail protein [Allosphingosinicella sp.]|uniref:phage tail protein n=1 Tax=Allosphingosinicella sp. TaxID=2823234 RepID=UPI002ED93CED
MKKPEGLKRVLVQWVPGLADNPGNLSLFVDKGRIATRGTGSFAFEYRYELSIVVQDFAGDVSHICVPLLAWIAEQQSELLEKKEPFTFERELLDTDLSDIEIKLELTEAVLVKPRASGEPGFDVTYIEEKPPAALDEFPGVCGAFLWQLFMGQDLLAQTTDPDFPGNQAP